MSLEAALKDHALALAENTAAAKALTAALNETNAGRDAALAALKDSGAAAPKATRGAKKNEPEAPKAVDYTGEAGFEKLRAVVAKYTAVDDETERDARKAKLVKALGLLSPAGVKQTLSAVPEDKRATMAGWFETLIAGENVAELEDEPAAVEDDLMG